MINRWRTAVLALAILSIPLAAQKPSLANLDPSADTNPESKPETILEESPVDLDLETDIEPEIEEPLNESFDDSSEPIDVTALKDSLIDLLPTSAPPPLTITHILPAKTPAAVIVNTREDTWLALKQYALFAQLSDAFGIEPSPQSLPLLPLGMDYTEDIQPWIGEGVAFALLPIPSIRTINPLEHAVTIIPIRDAAAFVDFIPTLAETRGELPKQLSYRTFPIWHWPEEFVPYDFSWDDAPEEDIELKDFPEVPPPNRLTKQSAKAILSPSPYLSTPVSISPSSAALPNAYRQPEPPYIYIPDPDSSSSPDGYTIPGYALAHLGNYIVMAETVDSLRQWIEYQTRGGPKLSSNPNFEKTQGHPEAQNSLATVYGNVGELLNFEFSNPYQSFGLPPIPQPSLSERATMSQLFSRVTFDALVYPAEKGMRLESHLYTEGVLPNLPPSPNADRSILGLIPAATYFMGSGYDISGFWNDVSTAFSLNEVTSGLIETARAIVSLTTGLDLDTDIFSWMDGEYSVFLFPSQSGLLNSFFPGLGLEAGVLLETSNRPRAETALTALDELIGEDIVVSTSIADYPVSSWQYDVNTDGRMDSVLTHTWITDDTLAFTSGNGAMERLVVPAGFHPLSGHSTFQNATASFPDPNNGYFYVNMSSTLSFFYNLFDFNQATDPWSVDIRSYFGTVRSLSLTTSSSTQQFQIDALLGLAASEPIAVSEETLEESLEETEESLNDIETTTEESENLGKE